jgi:hypothetical protein
MNLAFKGFSLHNRTLGRAFWDEAETLVPENIENSAFFGSDFEAHFGDRDCLYGLALLKKNSGYEMRIFCGKKIKMCKN